jgi:N-acetylglutamate synthase-like GNAT family acetyltransferase
MLIVRTVPTPPRLVAFALKPWERDALSSAVAKAGLPAVDIRAAEHLFWRFETEDEIPVGFGGLEIHGEHALLRSVVTLPPLRRKGVAAAIVDQIETEAALRHSRVIWLLTRTADRFFERLGYLKCDSTEVPEQIRATAEFSVLGPAGAHVMRKGL